MGQAFDGISTVTPQMIMDLTDKRGEYAVNVQEKGSQFTRKTMTQQIVRLMDRMVKDKDQAPK